MGVFTRPDSPYWWLWLETAPKGHQKVRTDIFVGDTPEAKRGSKVHARRVYAEKMLATNAASFDQDAKPTVRFGAYADTYARDVISHHKGAEREREILGVLRVAFRDLDLHELTRDAVRQWMTDRRSSASASTINREVDLLKAMLRDATPRYIDASPLRGMPRLKTIQPRRRVLSADEERRLLQAAKDDAQDYALLVLGIDTLQRMGDLLDLQRTDRKGQWIYIRDNKSSESLDVPLSPRAAKALDAITHDDPHYFVKFRKAENPRDWRSSVRQRLEYLCAEADVPFGKAKHGVTFHWATRRTGATKLVVRKKVAIPIAQAIGGWRSPDVLLKIYTEAQRADLAKAVGQKPSRKRR